MTLTPGTVISRLTSGQPSASAAISWSTAAISVSRKSTWRRPASTVSRSQTASCCSASQRPALDAEEVRGGRAVLQAAHQHRVDLVLGPRARPDQLRSPREPAAHHPDTLIRRPDPVELARPQQLGQACGRRGGRSWRAPGGSRCRSARRRSPARHARSRIRAIAHALPVTSNATQSRASRLWANSSSASGRVWIRPAERSRPSATIATSQKSRWTSSATALTRFLLALVDSGRTGGQTTSTDPRSQRNQASRRGGHRKARARSPSRKAACPTCVLPKAPVPVTEPKPATG